MPSSVYSMDSDLTTACRVVSFAQAPRRKPPLAAVDNRLDFGRHIARSCRVADYAVDSFLHRDLSRNGQWRMNVATVSGH